MKNVIVMMVVFLFLFSNLYGNITGMSMNNDNAGNNITISSRDIIQNPSRSNNGLANSPWPMYRHDLKQTGQSQYDTSMNNGHEKWNFTTGGPVQSSPAIGPEGTIYVGSNDYKLYAVNPDGTQKWAFATGSFVGSSPAIDSEGTIYIGSQDGNLYAIYSNGTKKWTFTTGGSIVSAPVIGSDGTIYVGSYDNLYALNPDGTQKWAFATGGWISKSLAIDSNGTVYVGSQDGNLYAIYPNGTKKWAIFFAVGHQYLSPAIDPSGTIYLGLLENSGYLYSVNPNGIFKLIFKPGSDITSGPAIGTDGTIYVGTTDNMLYAINPNGNKIWSFSAESVVVSGPAIGSDGTIYFGSSNGKFYAIYSNGTKKWDYTTGACVGSSPSIDSDGTIYFGSDDGKLYAIGNKEPSAPRDLIAIGGNAKVTLNWNAPRYNSAKGILNYSIYRGTESGSETFLVRIGNETTYEDNNVMNGQIYYYKVTANNTFGEGPKSNEANATPATTPTAPLDLTAHPGNSRIVLNWTIPVDNGGALILNYTVYRNGTRHAVLGNVLAYTDTGLVNGVTYSYNISALNQVGEGPKSVGASATPRTVPTAPRNLQAIPENARITLQWLLPENDGGTSITNYSIYRGISPGNETLFVKGYNGGTSWVDTNITVGTKYYFMVSAVNAAGEGPKSNEQNATPYGVPKAPTLFAVSGNSNISLSWTVPGSYGVPISNYCIYRGTNSGAESLLVKIDLGKTSWVDTNITVNTKYYYEVSAVNVAGEGPRSNEQNATAYAVPSAPILSATAGTLTITLSWTVPNSNGASIANYSVYRGSVSGGEQLYIVGFKEATSLIDTNITPGATYYYMVSAVNIAGEGPKSNERNVTARNTPGVPTRLTASEGSSKVILRWSTPINSGTPLKYNIYRSDSKAGNYDLIASSNTTSYSDAGLKNGHKYWYKINAQNSVGSSANSTIVSATPYSTSLPSGYLLVIIIVIIAVLIIVDVIRSPRKKKA